MSNNKENLLNSVVAVVSAYVARTQVPVEDLPRLIRDVHRTLSTGLGGGEQPLEPPRRKPAAAPGRSVKPDAIVCLEDGKSFRSLKKHLRVAHGLTPSEYRVRWALGPDYPMTAPTYAATRSRLAKKAGLGKSGDRGRGKRSRKRARAELTHAA